MNVSSSSVNLDKTPPTLYSDTDLGNETISVITTLIDLGNSPNGDEAGNPDGQSDGPEVGGDSLPTPDATGANGGGSRGATAIICRGVDGVLKLLDDVNHFSGFRN